MKGKVRSVRRTNPGGEVLVLVGVCVWVFAAPALEQGVSNNSRQGVEMGSGPTAKETLERDLPSGEGDSSVHLPKSTLPADGDDISRGQTQKNTLPDGEFARAERKVVPGNNGEMPALDRDAVLAEERSTGQNAKSQSSSHVSLSAQAPYCDGLYQQGDIVKAAVDHPAGSGTLYAGMRGRLVCCDPDDPVLPLLVTWFDWSDGHDQTSYCHDTTIEPGPAGSHWWVSCEDVIICEAVGELPTDINRDGCVDEADLLMLMRDWGQCCPSSPGVR